MVMTRVLLVMALCGFGCSFLGVRSPRSRGVRCTDDYSVPIVDATFTTAAVATAIAGVVSASRCSPDADFCPGGLIVIPAVVIGLPYGVSTLYGFSAVRQCRAYRRTQHTRLGEPPAPLRPPPAVPVSPPSLQTPSPERARVLDDMLLEAKRAAHAGDCDRARRLAARLRIVDQAAHDTILAADTAVQSCQITAPPASE